jgi:butyryl-CoA dehydrogenase
VGTLVGQPNKGLAAMFVMMNAARLGVGNQSLGLTEVAYQNALAYAKDRPQGRAPTNKDPASKPLAIIEHADVKRMLLQQKTYVEGGLALCLLAARLVDDHEANHDEDAGILLDLLTPIVKSYPSYYGPKANDLAIQVLGGAGYIREYPVEQLYRDNRLNPIHEGTHGIQSLDLLGRKLWQHQGRGQKLLFQRIQATLQQAQQHTQLQPLCAQYGQSLQKFMQTVLTLGETLQQGEVEKALANSAIFLDVMSQYVVGWLWLEMAQHALASCNVDDPWLQGKLHAARYQIEWELPLAEAQLPQLQSCNDSWASMQRDWF